MELSNLDLVASLQALPETDPIEVEGIQLGGDTCQAVCIGILTLNLLNTVCVGVTCA